jgi:hypothetical protein
VLAGCCRDRRHHTAHTHTAQSVSLAHTHSHTPPVTTPIDAMRASRDTRETPSERHEAPCPNRARAPEERTPTFLNSIYRHIVTAMNICFRVSHILLSSIHVIQNTQFRLHTQPQVQVSDPKRKAVFLVALVRGTLFLSLWLSVRVCGPGRLRRAVTCVRTRVQTRRAGQCQRTVTLSATVSQAECQVTSHPTILDGRSSSFTPASNSMSHKKSRRQQVNEGQE